MLSFYLIWTNYQASLGFFLSLHINFHVCLQVICLIWTCAVLELIFTPFSWHIDVIMNCLWIASCSPLTWTTIYACCVTLHPEIKWSRFSWSFPLYFIYKSVHMTVEVNSINCAHLGIIHQGVAVKQFQGSNKSLKWNNVLCQLYTAHLHLHRCTPLHKTQQHGPRSLPCCSLRIQMKQQQLKQPGGTRKKTAPALLIHQDIQAA